MLIDHRESCVADRIADGCGLGPQGGGGLTHQCSRSLNLSDLRSQGLDPCWHSGEGRRIAVDAGGFGSEIGCGTGPSARRTQSWDRKQVRWAGRVQIGYAVLRRSLLIVKILTCNPIVERIFRCFPSQLASLTLDFAPWHVGVHSHLRIAALEHCPF